MLSGEGNGNGEKTTIGLISNKKQFCACSTLFLHVCLPLFCTTTTLNFQKLPGYTFYVLPVVVHFFHSLIFTQMVIRISHFLTTAKKFSCCSSNN